MTEKDICITHTCREAKYELDGEKAPEGYVLLTVHEPSGLERTMSLLPVGLLVAFAKAYDNKPMALGRIAHSLERMVDTLEEQTAVQKRVEVVQEAMLLEWQRHR